MGLILGGGIFLTALTGLWVIVADLVEPDLRQMRFGLLLLVVPVALAVAIARIGCVAVAPNAATMTIEQAEDILCRKSTL